MGSCERGVSLGTNGVERAGAAEALTDGNTMRRHREARGTFLRCSHSCLGLWEPRPQHRERSWVLSGGQGQVIFSCRNADDTRLYLKKRTSSKSTETFEIL